MEEILLKVEHVSKNFGATKALEDVSFTIKKGTIHSLLGRNGAGKSTVVNIIAGIYKQNSGIVTLEGNDITPYSVFERQNMGVKIVPQHASIVPELTVGENVFMGIWPRKKAALWIGRNYLLMQGKNCVNTAWMWTQKKRCAT